VRVEACALCPTDIKMYRHGHRDLSMPRILGHEVVGRVLESNSCLAVGDTVQVWPGVTCGTCPSCLKGADNTCANQGIIGFDRDGGFAEIMAVPPGCLDRGGVNIVPPSTSPVIASLAEPLGCVVHALRAARMVEEEAVLINGGGPMGQMACALASFLSGIPILVEPDERRRAMAKSMGAETVIDPGSEDVARAVSDATGGLGADIALLAWSGAPIDDGLLRMMAPRGRVLVFSGLQGGPSRTLDMNALHYRELSLIGSYGCDSVSNRLAARLISHGRVDLSPLISRTFKLDELERMMGMVERREVMKCVMTR